MAGALLNYNNQALTTPAGVYGINNLVPENIKSGVNIGGVVGTYQDTSADPDLVAYMQGDTWVLKSNITKVATYRFGYTTNMTQLNLPNCVSIADNAFQNTNSSGISGTSGSLSSINLPNCETIGNYAFYRRGGNFPSSLSLPKCKTIGNYAFYSCGLRIGNSGTSSFTSISLPVVETIGEQAFGGSSSGSYYFFCSATTLDLPKCTSIGTAAFSYLSFLTTITLRANQVCSIGSTNSIPANSNHHIDVYVPSDLIESYKVANNWSTLYTNGYITFYAIT